MQHYKKIPKTAKLIAGMSVVLGWLMLASPLSAAESSFSQGFTSDTELQIGTVVSLGANGRSVEKSSVDAADKMVGVITKGAVIEVFDANQREVQVATGGRTLALVSDINGDIAAGDKLTISPINGVGMATDSNGYIFGTAQADFNAAQAITSQQVTTKSGEVQTVRVGLLPVQVAVMLYDFDQENSILPQFLTDFANAIAGKEVSILRISVALAVLFIGTLSIGLILVSAVRSSIVSIGRNPLAARAVHKGLFQVLFITFGILIAMLAIIYIVLVI